MEEKIAVLIPVHNEEKNITYIIEKLKKKIKTIIVIDDGSTDNTFHIIKNSGVIVLRHETCKGKGEALKTGFKYIVAEKIPAVITMDGDGQHKVEDIENFLLAYRKKPKVSIWIGKRKIFSTNMPFLRKVTNISMSLLISFLAGQFIPDSQSGFRLIKREVLEKINLITSHFETESEILIKSSWKGFKISSVPIVTVYEGEKSKINSVSDTLRFFKMIIFLCCPLLRKIKWNLKN